MTESFSERIKKDVEELSDKSIFKSMYFCSFATCHAYKRHYEISRAAMLKRVQRFRGISVSRFYPSMSEDQISELVYEALSCSYKDIEKGLNNPKNIHEMFEVMHDFNHPIGEGCYSETGTRFFPMSRLCVVICRNPNNGRSFSIASFYPVSNMDEIDEVNDIIDGF